MKFPYLPIGTQFEFDGKTYTKISPLLAAAEDGSDQRVIPRYAVLRPIGAPVPATPAQYSRQLDPDKVMAAFERFQAECVRLLDEACGDDTDRCAALKASLAEAVRRFRHEL